MTRGATLYSNHEAVRNTLLDSISDNCVGLCHQSSDQRLSVEQSIRSLALSAFVTPIFSVPSGALTSGKRSKMPPWPSCLLRTTNHSKEATPSHLTGRNKLLKFLVLTFFFRSSDQRHEEQDAALAEIPVAYLLLDQLQRL